MHILILNWRDIKYPQAGGAEIFTHEIAERWVESGHKVTMISACFNGCKREENVNGVKIIRMGQWWSVHVLAFLYYIKNLRGKVDIVIDEVHWFPFFAKLYARDKTILLACEVANKLFFRIFPYPLAILCRLLEKVYLSIYRKSTVLTISPSSKHELIKEGFSGSKITVLQMGINVPRILPKTVKEKMSTLIYLGRINKQKGAEDALKAYKEIIKRNKDVKLWFVGRGNTGFVNKLKKEVKRSDLGKSVTFFGYISQEKKFELLARAHIIIVPSYHEGWGLIVDEAAFVGTPAVVYDVPGLRDVVENGVNGLICKSTFKHMASCVEKILEDKAVFNALQKNVLKKAKQNSWDNAAKLSLLKIIDFSKKSHR